MSLFRFNDGHSLDVAAAAKAQPWSNATVAHKEAMEHLRRAAADRIDQRKDSGFFVSGSAAGVYAEAMRALAREREQGQK